MRKRYSVVVRGVAGTVRDQTSEISRHRSEASAREAADTERHRLFVVRPDEAVNYRIAIYRDDRDLILDVPALTGETAPLPQGPEPDLRGLSGLSPEGPDAALNGATVDVAEGLPGADVAAAVTLAGDGAPADDAPPAQDATDDAATAFAEADDEGDTGRVPAPAARRRLSDEPLPDGPVPEDVIARFAQSLEREERRKGQRPR